MKEKKWKAEVTGGRCFAYLQDDNRIGTVISGNSEVGYYLRMDKPVIADPWVGNALTLGMRDDIPQGYCYFASSYLGEVISIFEEKQPTILDRANRGELSAGDLVVATEDLHTNAPYRAFTKNKFYPIIGITGGEEIILRNDLQGNHCIVNTEGSGWIHKFRPLTEEEKEQVEEIKGEWETCKNADRTKRKAEKLGIKLD